MLRHFLWSQLGGQEGRDAIGIYWVEARDAAQHLKVHGTAPPTTKNYLVQIANSTVVEKTWIRGIKHLVYNKYNILWKSVPLPLGCGI